MKGEKNMNSIDKNKIDEYLKNKHNNYSALIRYLLKHVKIEDLKEYIETEQKNNKEIFNFLESLPESMNNERYVDAREYLYDRESAKCIDMVYLVWREIEYEKYKKQIGC